MIPSVDSSEQVGNQTRCSMSALIADIKTGESITVSGYLGYGNDNQDKGPGKAVSYAYKYLMLKLFMLDIAKSDDIELELNQKDEVSETIDFELAKMEIKAMMENNPEQFVKVFKESKYYNYQELKLYGNKLRGL